MSNVWEWIFPWKCVTGKCHECKSLKPMSLDLSSTNHLVKFYQFEITKTPHTKTTSDGKTQQKISRKCERVSHEIPYKDAYSKLLSMKNLYTSHKFEVYNDVFNWPKVLETTKDTGEIYHMDFSENLDNTNMSSSLHILVKDNFPSIVPSSTCRIHMSIFTIFLTKWNNYAFTATVLRQLINKSSSDIICLKSDNCATQHKPKYVFKVFHSLAVKM